MHLETHSAVGLRIHEQYALCSVLSAHVYIREWDLVKESRFQHGHWIVYVNRGPKRLLTIVVIIHGPSFLTSSFDPPSLFHLGWLSDMTLLLHCIFHIPLPFSDCPSWRSNFFLYHTFYFPSSFLFTSFLLSSRFFFCPHPMDLPSLLSCL